MSKMSISQFLTTKIIPSIKKHPFDLITFFLIFILLFITPPILTKTEIGYAINLWLLVLVFFTMIVWKVYCFFRKNPRFKPSESVPLVQALGSIIAIIMGLLVGFIIMLLVNPEQAFRGFLIILQGGFYNGMSSLGTMIYYAVPIILTGLSVAFAFRTGLFNIGATGQLTIGAFIATAIGIRFTFLSGVPILHWLVAVIGAMIGGAIWGAIPGLLKAYRNVNEVVSSIMLNYIAVYLVASLIKSNDKLYYSGPARMYDILPSAVTPKMGLDLLFPNSSINGGIFLALLVALILYIILFKTTFGFELKAVGLNRDAAKYAGINAKRNIVISMIIAGAVAGIAGAMIYLNARVWFKPEHFLRPEGFTGIAISLLGLNHPFGVVLAGLFYGSLERGGEFINLLRFKPEIVDIIISVIIYVSALSLFLQKYIIKGLKIRFRKKKEAPEVATKGGDN